MIIHRRVAQAAVTLAAAALFMTAPTSRTAAQGGDGPLPGGPGVELVYTKCQQCHPIQYVVDSAGLPPGMWQYTLDLMKQLGLKASAEEEAALLDYLTVYLGPEPPPAAGGSTAEPAAEPGAQPASGSVEALAEDVVDGAAVYQATCAACHQPDGRGVQGTFPPLAGHAPELFAADRAYLPLVLLNGLQGPIEVAGHRYNAIMPAWTHLAHTEIAAVLNHVLTAWGNDAELAPGAAPYLAEEVAALSGEAVDMHVRRQELGLAPD